MRSTHFPVLVIDEIKNMMLKNSVTRE